MQTQQGLSLDMDKVNEAKGSKWYLADTHSNDQASNAAIGVDNIVVTGVESASAQSVGAVAQVQLHTVVGSFYFSVFRGKADPSSLRLAIPSREYVDKDGVKQYQEHYQLNSSVRAQVLKHVHAKCKQAEVVAQQTQAQTQAPAPAGMDADMMAQFQQFLQFKAMQEQAPSAPAVTQSTEQPSVPGIIRDNAY